MVDSIDDKKKKVGDVNRTQNLSHIQKSESIREIKQTGKITGVGSVSGGNRRPTRVMSAREREELFKMVEEEAEKIFAASGVSKEQREAIELAVKKTIDAAVIEEDGDNTDETTKP